MMIDNPLLEELRKNTEALESANERLAAALKAHGLPADSLVVIGQEGLDAAKDIQSAIARQSEIIEKLSKSDF